MQQRNLEHAYELSRKLIDLEKNILLMDIKKLVDIRIEKMTTITIRNDQLKELLEAEINQVTRAMKSLGVKEFGE